MRARRHALITAVSLVLVACQTAPSEAASSAMGSGTAQSSAPSPSASAPPTASVQVEWAEQPFEGNVNAVVADGAQFVALGNVDGSVASWTSSDGVTWRRDPVPDPIFDEDVIGPTGIPIDLARGPGGGQLVRLGDTLYSFGTSNFMDHNWPVGWRRTDGAAWEYIVSQSAFFSAGVVVDVTASNSALLASTMGGNPEVPSGLDYAYSASTWLWTPETSWVRSGLAATPEDRIHITATAWSNRTYVAVGVRAEPTEGQIPSSWPTTPSIWRSADGRTWANVTLPEGLGALCTVRALPTGGFIGIEIADGVFTAWTSETGAAWTGSGPLPARGLLPSDVPGPFLRGCAVVPLERGLLATVRTEDGLLTWTSADGRTWEPGERLDLSVFGPPVVAALGSDVVVFGTRRDASGGGRPVLLHGTVQP